MSKKTHLVDADAVAADIFAVIKHLDAVFLALDGVSWRAASLGDDGEDVGVPELRRLLQDHGEALDKIMDGLLGRAPAGAEALDAVPAKAH